MFVSSIKHLLFTDISLSLLRLVIDSVLKLLKNVVGGEDTDRLVIANLEWYRSFEDVELFKGTLK